MATASLFDVLPAGFIYQPDFISPEEERALVAEISAMEFGEVRMRGVAARRRVRQFGWRYSFESYRVTPGAELPEFLVPVRDRAAALAGVPSGALSEALVTEYPPGATIGWHRDAPMFGVVAGVSLLAPCTFKLRRGDGRAEREPKPALRSAKREGAEKPIKVELAPRSAYVLDGEARRDWQHSIPAVRSLRYSITFRTLRTPA